MAEKMSAEKFRNAAKVKKPAKYRNVKVTVNGIKFDSKKEADRYLYLLGEERGGFIRDLQLQVHIHLHGQEGPVRTPKGRHMRYVADFSYVCCDTGLTVYEDAKGMRTPEFNVKAGIIGAMGLELRVV